MSEKRDDRIAQFFREAAPPARDPVFRLKVLERLEQRRFQRQVSIMGAGVLLILAASLFARSMGEGDLQTVGALAVSAAVGTAYFAFQGGLWRTLRRFRI